MILYANGCSMTYGDELPPEDRERFAWPGQLSELMKASAVNHGIQGGSNDRVVRRTMRYVADHLRAQDAAGLFVVIGWTNPFRREFGRTRAEHEHDDEFYGRLLPAFKNTRVPEMAKAHDLYYSEFSNDREAEVRYITQVISLQTFLKHHGIRYLFFKALPSIPECDKDDALLGETKVLTDMVDLSRFYKFRENHAFITESNSVRKLPFGPGLHPLEEGHRMWAEVLHQHIDRHGL